jgi:TonB family protein
MDKPAFSLAEEDKPLTGDPASPTIRDLAAGKFDDLFKGGPDKPSAIYRDAQNPLAPPMVGLVTSTPMLPETVSLPAYPALARAAHVQGMVSFTAGIDNAGAVTNVRIESGHPLFHQAVLQAVGTWKVSGISTVQATIGFSLDCANH